jgi:hypothetical protein
MISEFPMVPTDGLFAKIEENLNQYTNNGLLDVGKFFTEVKFMISKLGIAAYELTEAVIFLENHRGELPCNFYLLDSAWLCDTSRSNTLTIPQSKFIMYSQLNCERIAQKTCNSSSEDAVRQVISNGVVIQSTPCNNNNEQILDKVTITEYIKTGHAEFTYRNPVLLRLNNRKTTGNPVCTDKCKNLFAKSLYEISITQQGYNKYIHSTLEEPTIYLKYYAYPEDPDTGLPLIPDDPTIQRAIEYHLMYTFFYMLWLNGDDPNIEKKVADLGQKRDMYLREAINYSTMPSFNKSIEYARNARKKWAAYELINSRHI